MTDLMEAMSKMDLFTTLNIASSMGLAISGFYISFSIQAVGIHGSGWFTSLRFILAFIAIAAVSNLYTIIILGKDETSPTQLCLNISVLLFFIWMTAYYAKNIVGKGTTLTEAKVKNFIVHEHDATITEKTNDPDQP